MIFLALCFGVFIGVCFCLFFPRVRSKNDVPALPGPQKSSSPKSFQRSSDVKNSCFSCQHRRKNLRFWCTNKQAVSSRNSAVPNAINCPFHEKISFFDIPISNEKSV